MAETFDDFKGKLDHIQTGVGTIGASVQALKDQLAALQAGSVMTQAQLDALGTEADTISGAVDSINTPPTP